jgi:GntR family transcriptional regulator / MocR family aminotransferase
MLRDGFHLDADQITVESEDQMWRLQITLRRDPATPLREQLRHAIQHKIKTGELQPGVRLPSTRALAADLRLARSVVVDAYQQLIAEGYLTSTNRSGTRVADLALSAADPSTLPMAGAPAADSHDPPIRWDLRTGLPDTGAFPRREWSSCLVEIVRTLDTSQLEYPAVAGVTELRGELAAYLGRVRAVRTSWDHVMITAGFAQGLSVLCHTLRRHGHKAIAVEDPGHPGEHRFIEGTGLLCVPVPVDEEGIDVDALAASGVRAVLVTPTHQFPTGVTLSPRRRAALTTWARRVDGLVIEDDYDGEYWFDRGPRPSALQGMAPEHVVYGSSVSKTLAPAIRLGWLAVPPAWMPAVERTRQQHDLGTSTVDQYAYQRFIRTGRLDRHLRRITKRYEIRYQALARALATELPELRLSGAAAGLHALATLPDGVDELNVVRAAEKRGVLVRGLNFFVRERPQLTAGLVIGFARHSSDLLATAVATLAEATRDHTLAPLNNR